MYAKALYDNVADTPDELTFKRGEILNVIEQDTDGLTGWWLCSLRGRQVIYHNFFLNFLVKPVVNEFSLASVQMIRMIESTAFYD